VKEKEKEWAAHEVDTVAAVVVTEMEGRRKKRKRRHRRLVSLYVTRALGREVRLTY